LGDLVGLYFASPSIIVPCAGIIFPSNYLISRFIFDESNNTLYPTLTIMLSIILLIVITGTSTCTENCSLLDHWKQIPFLVYFILASVVILGLLLFIRKVNQEILKKTTENQTLIDVNNIQIYIINELDQEIIYNKLDDKTMTNLNDLYGVTMCIVAGFFSSCSLLSVKVIIELLNTQFETTAIILTFIGSIFLLIIFFVTQQHYYNKVLKLFNLSFCVPIFQCSLISFSTISAIILFEEYKLYNVFQEVCFPLSLLGILISCMWLSKITHDENKLKNNEHPILKDLQPDMLL
jgi:DMSO/TMAO reductase YedYZ heme-binding membrane subunit